MGLGLRIAVFVATLSCGSLHDVDMTKVAKPEQQQNSVQSGATACRTSGFWFQRESSKEEDGFEETIGRGW
jgi:hypothetical protein